MGRLGLLVSMLSMGFVMGCQSGAEETNGEAENASAVEDDFDYFAEQFADLKILRYTIPGFDELDLKTKKLCYYLYEAAHSGREIIADQNNKHNLTIRRTLENILQTYSGDKDAAPFAELEIYLKKVWFANGIHHHYSTKKHKPGFSREYFAQLVEGSDQEGFPLSSEESVDDLVERLTEIIFDASVDAKRVNKDPEADPVAESANNFYEGVKIDQVREFYAAMKVEGDTTPISYGLNSQVVMGENGLEERVWKVGGMYTEAIEQIVYWLKLASGVAENDNQKKALDLLIEYYETGNLRKFDDYCIAWVADTNSRVDVVNGFIEVYGDAISYRGSYESVVSIKDLEATKRIKAISDEAQWFEDNSSIMDEHKKTEVKGISAKVITIVTESGDASPSTPIGINLPNANWIRSTHGSKSVNLGNVVYAYNQSKKSGGLLEEFAFSDEEIERTKKHAALAGNLHTDMHEVIGHASGKINPGIGSPKETLPGYSSTLEEARADLVALYYLLDDKLIEIGVMETIDVGKAEYDGYIRNGLMQQLVRLDLGDNLEEAHMRNRQLVAAWAFERGAADNVIEKVKRDGKTYFTIRDYEKLQGIFGELLREIQRIKSEGDGKAGKDLVENYGVKVDRELHAEVLKRFEKLNVAPYSGFINPILEPVMKDGEIVDIKVSHTKSFTTQMLGYSKKYSFLPNYN
ncbi:MAG: dihydrofolate reductase [Flavobacteriales bacterium]|nr:dihydrofolate reductase [Flavobacteriales bacterium]